MLHLELSKMDTLDVLLILFHPPEFLTTQRHLKRQLEISYWGSSSFFQPNTQTADPRKKSRPGGNLNRKKQVISD